MSWFGQLFRRRRLYNELAEEIRAHLDEKIASLVAAGMPRASSSAALSSRWARISSARSS